MQPVEWFGHHVHQVGTKCGYLDGGVGYPGAFSCDIAAVLGVLPHQYVGVPVTDNVQQVGEAALGSDTCEHIRLHVVSVLCGVTIGVSRLTLLHIFQALVKTGREKPKAIGFYGGADARY